MGLFTREKLETLECLFDDQLEDLYDAEHRLTEAIPQMADKATATDLKDAFKTHLKETQIQVERLETIFELRGKDPKRKTCDAMKGLVSEGEDVIKAKGDPDVIDAALIAAAQRVEHYEMAGYGTLRNLAQRLGMHEAADLLQQTLDEESDADSKLTSIATNQVNAAAASAT
ncbi:hypothetical protein KOR42_46470 [Thalassoglobus neptunius]|uniref:Uncharacterized protein n=1 Tax=Thalassoglobus neptunius TaxID=1938619 RepID=A0A5C5VZA0_9PLAN|nr:ferritin-like domain-containing protein [Thalassoglobus neptunius]TWT42792.1 hypothetical protein KOR42_46470 [Thalassoglobus neptunius]